MEYILSIQSKVIVGAKTLEDATNQVNEVLEDARKRNCGGISEEILANAVITKMKIKKTNDE